MEKTKLKNIRIAKGFSYKDIADLMLMEEYSYRRREKGDTKISNKEWQKLAEILKVDVEDIFQSEYSGINIHNENGQVNNNIHKQKIQCYKIPKEMAESQHEYIVLLKEQKEALAKENDALKKENDALKKENDTLKKQIERSQLC